MSVCRLSSCHNFPPSLPTSFPSFSPPLTPALPPSLPQSLPPHSLASYYLTCSAGALRYIKWLIIKGEMNKKNEYWLWRKSHVFTWNVRAITVLEPPQVLAPRFGGAVAPRLHQSSIQLNCPLGCSSQESHPLRDTAPASLCTSHHTLNLDVKI